MRKQIIEETKKEKLSNSRCKFPDRKDLPSNQFNEGKKQRGRSERDHTKADYH